MSTGGRLTIKTSNVTIDKEYCTIVSDATTGPAIMISVADTGPCISSKQHIFDPCAQIKQAGKGLELPVACMIVKLHNGWMTAESRRETGTEIRTYLPAEK
jgi:nitrogen-specific signal transduction histidine kinase